MRLHECKIADEAHWILDGLGHDVVGLLLAVERKLAALHDPDISWRTTTAETGFFRALAGKRRDVLVIEHSRFREHAVLVSCKAHGVVLHVSWMVVVTPRLANDMQRLIRFEKGPGQRFDVGAELDVFDVMDLRAFFDITRLVLKKAMRELTDDESLGDVDNDG